MSIPMEVPARFLRGVIDGKLTRYGCVLKEAATGRIVGHLKEVGQAGAWLAGGPLGPVAMATDALLKAGQWAENHYQLAGLRSGQAAILRTLESLPPQLARMEGALRHLQLIGSVGAAASVVGLGVCVAGFALVLRRLGRLEHNLNEAMGRLRQEVERVHLKLDMLQMAELRAAWEQLAGSRRTSLTGRSGELLRKADGVFQMHRNYYYCLISELRPLEQVKLDLPHTRELLGRFLACGQAELEANFLLGDLCQWHYRHEAICRQVEQVYAIDARKVLHARVDSAGLLPGRLLSDLTQQLVLTRDYCRESKARIETARGEVDWMEQNGCSPEDYLRQVGNAPDEGVVLVRHSR